MKASSKLTFVLLSTSLLLSGCGASSGSSSSSVSSSTGSSSSEASSASSSSSSNSSSSSSSDKVSTGGSKSSSSSSSSISSSDSSSSSSSSSTKYDLAALQSTYGAFSITPDTTEGASASFDEATNVYTLAYCATRPTYTLKGYFDGEILISNVNTLSSIDAGVSLSLDAACLVSENDNPCVYYSEGSKALKIDTKAETDNLILALGTSDAISSEKNAELGSEGSLSIYSKEGHGLSAGDMRVYGKGTIDVEAAKDGLHGSTFITNNDADTAEEMVYLTGTLNIHDVGSQAIEATTKKTKGKITIDSGAKILIDNATAVAKTDVSFTNAGSVIATNITGDAFTTDNTGNCTISTTGVTTVNGTSYLDTTI